MNKFQRDIDIDLKSSINLDNMPEDIDTVGMCANCGVEYHIHKETHFDPIKFGHWLLRSGYEPNGRSKNIYINWDDDDPTQQSKTMEELHETYLNLK